MYRTYEEKYKERDIAAHPDLTVENLGEESGRTPEHTRHDISAVAIAAFRREAA